MKHFVQLRTACDCTRIFEVHTCPGTLYEVLLSPDFQVFDNTDDVTVPVVLRRRLFRLHSDTKLPNGSGTIHEYVEVLKQ